MRYTKKPPLIVTVISFFFTLLVSFDTKAYSEEVKSDNKIVIELDSIPSEVKPGDKPITLAPDLLSKLLPELKNPRLMSFEDLYPIEHENFIEGGYTFVLTGDFNKDKVADVAFVGKYDNPENSKENTFIVIVSIKGKKVIREYFEKLYTEKVALKRLIEYKPKIDAIFMSFDVYTNDYCGILYWTNRKYQFKPCQWNHLD